MTLDDVRYRCTESALASTCELNLKRTSADNVRRGWRIADGPVPGGALGISAASMVPSAGT
jgi:hypothetical protein